MKKVLLSLLALAVSAASFAQTNSIATGNDKTTNGEGYLFLFNYPSTGGGGLAGADVANCMTGGAYTQLVNFTGRTGVTTAYVADGAADVAGGGGAVKYSLASNYTGETVVTKFQTGNCSSAMVDLAASNTIAQGIDIMVKSSVDVADFGVYLGFLNNGQYIEGDRGIATQSLKAGVYTLLHYNVIGTAWNHVKLDSTKALGFSFKANNGSTPAVGDITIDFVRVGDAVNTSTVDPTFATSKSMVFPNPVSSNEALTVSGVKGNVSMKLLNSTGSVVTSVEGTTLNLNNVNAGLYFLEVNSNGSVKTEKIVVR